MFLFVFVSFFILRCLNLAFFFICRRHFEVVDNLKRAHFLAMTSPRCAEQRAHRDGWQAHRRPDVSRKRRGKKRALHVLLRRIATGSMQFFTIKNFTKSHALLLILIFPINISHSAQSKRNGPEKGNLNFEFRFSFVFFLYRRTVHLTSRNNSSRNCDADGP